jgi:DNA-binding transcriptional LysR family regulator
VIDIARMHLLEQLGRRGSMAAVAAAVGYSPSAVSQQLAALQREAGVTLLERVGRGVRLTPEGERLAEHARAVLEELERAEADLAEGSGTPRGRVLVGSFASAATRLVLPALRRARDRYPGLTPHLRVSEPPAALEALLRGESDLALAYDYSLVPLERDPALRYTPLRTEDVVLATDGSGGGGLADLRGFAAVDWIVGADETADHDLVVRACAVAGFAPRLGHACDDFRVIAGLVSSGLGVALVPRDAYPWQEAGVTVRPVAGARLGRRTFLAVRPAAAGRASVRVLVDLVRAEALSGPAMTGP